MNKQEITRAGVELVGIHLPGVRGKFKKPEGFSSSVELEPMLAKMLLMVVESRFGVSKLPTLGPSDVCLSHAQLEHVLELSIKILAKKTRLPVTSARFKALRLATQHWALVPYSRINFWWNSPPADAVM